MTSRMQQVAAFSPTPTQPPFHPQQSVYYAYPAQIDPNLSYPAMTTPNHPHQMAQGRMAMPMSSSSNMSSTPSHHQPRGPSPFPQEDTPYLTHQQPGASEVSPLMMGGHVVSPTDHREMHQRGQQMVYNHPQPVYRPGYPPRAQGRPQMQRGNTMHAAPPRPHMNRGNSLQMHGPRSASPSMMGGDIFDPAPRPSTGNGSPRRVSEGYTVEHNPGVSHGGYQYAPEQLFYPTAQGISPARALGPAPLQVQYFSPHRDDPLNTPVGTKIGYNHAIHSSAASVATCSSLTASTRASMDDRRSCHLPSDDEADSPTRSSRMPSHPHFDERPMSRGMPLITRPPMEQPLIRPTRPLMKPTVSGGGRTSAKFAKVADDPGVEGVPPGYRSNERPGPSFACIIGQAILKCKAGGLSLEHIYRYVETAYPYFKSGDGAWRNSVRHNLSIHKMFETIARTEKYPPGKGGIWIIHEEEKCHWPEDNKFIKNFPPSHHHHAICRQTRHERQKEDLAIERAAKEGRVYVPKKGKKGRKAVSRDDDEEPRRDPCVLNEGHKMIFTPRTELQGLPTRHDFANLDFEEEVEDRRGSMNRSSLPLTSPAQMPISQEDKMARGGAMAPPTFGHRKRMAEEEDGVFTVPKRVRMISPMPLSQIHAQPHDNTFDDSFITPERERPMPTFKATNSAFKTPALVNTSSSPGSSPLPPTITRSTHHPSGLQQGWTHDDIAGDVTSSSPALQMLDSAFDFQPKTKTQPTRMLPPPIDDTENYPAPQLHGPPKTPISRSSAMTRTPRANLMKTPFMMGSPGRVPPSTGADMSTPMWILGGILDRMKNDDPDSPTQAPGGSKGLRSPVPPTSPERYATMGSPRKGGAAKDLSSL